MDLLTLFMNINSYLALPSTLLFFGVGFILTLKTNFIQIRAFPRFIRLILQGIQQKSPATKNTMNSFHALFTAMGTTIGMGNIVGPSLAIMAGGPGALFWLLVYMFFGSVTKFTEVVFAIKTRQTLSDGYLIGGPMYYLRSISPLLASWYVTVMTFLFIGWSAIQSNTLAQIFAQEAVPEWVIGIILALFVALILRGGAKRVGNVASKLVPIMCLFYIFFAFTILLKDLAALRQACMLVLTSAFNPTAAMGGMAGITVLTAMRTGIFKAIFITEAGLGTSSIPHAIADTTRPTDQGVLALFSMLSDAFLCTLSGLMTLVTGAWLNGVFRSTIMYEIFKANSPQLGSCILLASVTMFVLTTVIGNSFNGIQTFSSITNHRWINWYIGCTMVMIFIGSMLQARLAWEIMDTFLTLVAIPNLIGILLLAFKRPAVLRE